MYLGEGAGGKRDTSEESREQREEQTFPIRSKQLDFYKDASVLPPLFLQLFSGTTAGRPYNQIHI